MQPAACRLLRSSAEPMNSQLETVQLIAELALGLAGFAGVASAFSGRERVYRPIERIRFVSVLQTSGTTLAGCLAILILHAAGVGQAIILRGVALVGLAATALFYLPQILRVFQHAGDAESTSEPWAVWLSVVHLVVLAGLYAYQIVQVEFVWPILASFAQQLIFGLWMFGRILLRPN